MKTTANYRTLLYIPDYNNIAKLNLNSTQLNSTQTEVEMVYIST